MSRTFRNVVYFAHGKESGPWGTKITRLAKIARARGFHVESPDYTFTMDPEKRVAWLLELNPRAAKNLVLVGSSMGGYVAAVASRKLHPAGLFLLAPAFGCPGYARQDPKPRARRVAIVHGWDDDVVPVENSIRFARKHNAVVHLVPSDHRLMNALSLIERLFGDFLGSLDASENS